MKIGVFDSGVGGLSVVNAIQMAMPQADVVYLEDWKNVPYGNKSVEELKDLVIPILQKLVSYDVEVIVIACNTITTNLIDDLRLIIPVPLIGMEPMVQEAAKQTHSKTIAVCATPATLASKRYAWLKREYAFDVKVLEPDCSNWSSMIEHNALQRDFIEQEITKICKAGVDVIVLGCTHYHWIESEIKQVATKFNAKVLQPEKQVISELKRVLK